MFLFLKIICLFFWYSFCSGISQLDVYFFNVGQANFTLLKINNYALVIDCGTTRTTEKSGRIHKKMQELVTAILGSIKPTVLISHMDSDHYCGLNKFFPHGTRGKVIVGGILTANPKIPADLQSDDVVFVENKRKGSICDQNNNSQKTNIGELLGKVLGEDENSPKVECFLPIENNSQESNEQNLVIKVTYAGKSILFPGDCSETLLGKLRKTEGFDDFFKNIDIFELSHHGDGHNGEFSLYGIMFHSSQERVPKYSIISSSPKGGNHIPKEEVMGFSYGKIGSTAPAYRCTEHTVSVYSSMAQNTIDISTSYGVFVTYNTDMYYKFKITEEGKIKRQVQKKQESPCKTEIFEYIQSKTEHQAIASPCQTEINFGFGKSNFSKIVLPNLGSTCYMDTVLQLLFPVLWDTIIRYDGSDEFLVEVKQLFECIQNKNQDESKKALKKIRDLYKKIGLDKVENPQKDAAEFLQFVLNYSKGKIASIKEKFWIQFKEHIERENEEKLYQRVKSCFLGLILSKSSDKTSLNCLMKEYFESNINENEKKITQISKVPNYFLITLNRLAYEEGESKRITTPCEIPDTIDLGAYCSDVPDNDKKLEFCGVIVHTVDGPEQSGGHYIVFLKNNFNYWVKFDSLQEDPESMKKNDMYKQYFDVSEKEFGSTQYSNPYILLYRKNYAETEKNASTNNDPPNVSNEKKNSDKKEKDETTFSENVDQNLIIRPKAL